MRISAIRLHEEQVTAELSRARLGQDVFRQSSAALPAQLLSQRELLEQAHFCYCTVWLLVLSFSLPSLKR